MMLTVVSLDGTDNIVLEPFMEYNLKKLITYSEQKGAELVG